MSDIIDKVVYFNQSILGIDQRKPAVLALNEVQITVKSLREEVQEFEDAYNGCMADDDTIKKEYETPYIVAMSDALIDNIYFAIGGLYKLGLTADQIRRAMDAVHDCNVQKKAGQNAKRATGAADAVKPDGWVGPEEKIRAIIMETIE